MNAVEFDEDHAMHPAFDDPPRPQPRARSTYARTMRRHPLTDATSVVATLAGTATLGAVIAGPVGAAVGGAVGLALGLGTAARFSGRRS